MEQSISILDKDYSRWIIELSSRYRRSQVKAAVKVNQEMILFYLELGRDIVMLDAENKYGSAFYASLSRDLKHALPDASGLSESNIRYAKRCYVLYSKAIGILQQLAEESVDKCLHAPSISNPQQVAEDFDSVFAHNVITDLCNVPWGHHMTIIDKVKGDMKKALFFVHQTVQNGWSRNMLLNFLDTDLYERQGKALTNFSRTLPDESSDLAQELTKDPYDFAFTGITGRYNERLLKDKLLNNITRFLVELGKGFAYVGKEYRIQNSKYINEDSKCCKIPDANRDFWVNKIRRNQERDQTNYGILSENGWQVIVVWECQLKANLLESTMRQVEVALQDNYLRTFSHKAKTYILVDEENLPLAAEDTIEYN